MKFLIENKPEITEVRHITISINKDKEFRISVNNFGELVILKSSFGEESGSINIIPNVSNVIHIK